jgi:hypothetical protein
MGAGTPLCIANLFVKTCECCCKAILSFYDNYRLFGGYVQLCLNREMNIVQEFSLSNLPKIF